LPLIRQKGTYISIRGAGDHDWKIIPVNSFKRKIPLEVLETLTTLRQHGIEFHGYGIAEPVGRPSARSARDPILLGHFGKYWIEIGRWE
jgi:hypothetical protein